MVKKVYFSAFYSLATLAQCLDYVFKTHTVLSFYCFNTANIELYSILVKIANFVHCDIDKFQAEECIIL